MNADFRGYFYLLYSDFCILTSGFWLLASVSGFQVFLYEDFIISRSFLADVRNAGFHVKGGYVKESYWGQVFVRLTRRK